MIFRIVYSGIHFSINHGLECLKIHRMEYITAVIIKGKYGAIGIPAIAHIPFFYLATCHVYTEFIIASAGFGKETFNDRRKEKPVRVGWIYTAKFLEFLEITLFG